MKNTANQEPRQPLHILRYSTNCISRKCYTLLNLAQELLQNYNDNTFSHRSSFRLHVRQRVGFFDPIIICNPRLGPVPHVLLVTHSPPTEMSSRHYNRKYKTKKNNGWEGASVLSMFQTEYLLRQFHYRQGLSLIVCN